MNWIAIIFVLVCLLLIGSAVFRAGQYHSLKIQGVLYEVKLEPLPKATKMHHAYVIELSFIEDLGSDIHIADVYKIMDNLREEVSLSFESAEVLITGRNSRPWFL